MTPPITFQNLNPNRRVTVLMATYNGALYIGEQLATIRSQVGVDLKLVIHDDGSSDPTVEKVNLFRRNFPDISCSIAINTPGTGSAPLNFFTLIVSADIGNAEYVALSDQDDIWLPNKLSRAIDVMEESGTDAYASNLFAWDVAGGKFWTIGKSEPQKAYDHLFQSASAGCTYVLSRRSFEMVRDCIAALIHSAPRTCSHDYLIYALVRSAGMTWSIDNQAKILYRQHSNNDFGAMPGAGGALKRLKLVRSGWYLSTVSWTLGNIQHDHFTSEVGDRIRRLNMADRWWLMTRVGQFRRKRAHQFALFMIFLLSSKP
jgi:rhamnosyltransferase